MIKVDLSGAAQFFTSAGPDYALAGLAHKKLVEKSGLGSEFTGWMELPQRIKETELEEIIATAEKIRSRSKALVVVGIGGSYLGARGAIELLKPLPGKDDPQIFFVGNMLSADSLCDTLDRLGDMDFDVNVISKSGTTLEPAVSFRIFRELLEKKYGDKADEHIFATTDAHKGVLKSLADARGWETFVVPDDVGGRFSVLSAVGLLPMAVAGIDVRRVIDAAIEELNALSLQSPENPAWKYAAARQHLYAKDYDIEILACYEPSFRFMAEWWKQLYGESEGKDGKGIFPASVEYTADLHSMGQYIQSGPRKLMETVVRFSYSRRTYTFPYEAEDTDGLNYIAGRDISEVGHVAADAVRDAHVAGGVPNMIIEVPMRNEEGFAALVCFFEVACAISGYMSGVNPFDQPGVEAYKKNMFRMLGKPGT
ncbi:MAG TPA: glucose-6-phosphate isomerase [Candidatus Limivicinus faecipullorum]|nr:glucose-6-phosphate isomerase [Candidatus Limivicinus faecipullorum]